MKSKLVKVDYSYYTPKGYNKHNYDYGIGVSEMKAIDACLLYTSDAADE